MKTLSGVAHAFSDNLITRAADVILKERRRLVLITREAPLNLAHLRNMVAVTEMGGVIFPPVPAFYSRAKTIDDLVNHTVGRVLDLFDVQHESISRWGGMKHDISKNDNVNMPPMDADTRRYNGRVPIGLLLAFIGVYRRPR